MTRIVFIGAGSVEFTRNLLGDILTFPELADAEIVLHDIVEERLATAEAMARWTNDAVGARARITTTTDRRRALDGADFAVNTIEVGGHRRHAARLRHPAASTACGRPSPTRRAWAPCSALCARSRCFSASPSDMAELCPERLDAQLHQPDGDELLGLVRGLVSPEDRRPLPLHPEHEPRRVQSTSASRFEEVTFLGAGVNHMSWVLRLERDGESLYPLAGRGDRGRPRGPRPPRPRPDLQAASATSPPSRASTSPSTCRGSCATTPRSSGCASPWTSTSGAARRTWSIYAEEKRKLAAGEPFELERSGEYASLIIHSMVTGQPRTVYGNVRNTGLITNLPQDACVEVPCLVDRAGVQPTVVGDAPAAVRGARPHLPQRRRAHRPRRPRGAPRPRPAGRPARSQRRGHALAGADRRDWSTSCCAAHARRRCRSGSGDRP